MIDLNPALVNIYGYGGSGKSNFIRYILSKRKYSRHVIYDYNGEYDSDKYNVYRPTNKTYESGGNDEVNEFIKHLIELPPAKRPRYVVLDEAADYLPGGGKPMGEYVSRMAHHNTHLKPGMTLITSNRSITGLNPTIREMFNHMFVFGLRGDNSIRQARNLASDLPDVVDDLNEYEFCHVDQSGEISRFEPVKNMDKYRTDTMS